MSPINIVYKLQLISILKQLETILTYQNNNIINR